MGWEEEKEENMLHFSLSHLISSTPVRVANPKCYFLGTFGVHGKGGGKYVSLLFITPTHGHIKSARMTGETMMIVTKIMNFG